MSHQSNDILERIKNATAKAEVDRATETERARLADLAEKQRHESVRKAISTTIIVEIDRLVPALKDPDWDRSEWSESVEKRMEHGRKSQPIHLDNLATLWFKNPLDGPNTLFARTYFLMVALTPGEREVFLVGGWCRNRPRANERRSHQHKLEMVYAHHWTIDELTQAASKEAVEDVFVKLIPALGN